MCQYLNSYPTIVQQWSNNKNFNSLQHLDDTLRQVDTTHGYIFHLDEVYAIEPPEAQQQKLSTEEKLQKCLEAYYKLCNQVLFLLSQRESFCFISGKSPSFSLIGFKLCSITSPYILLHILLEPLNLDYMKYAAKIPSCGNTTLHNILSQMCEGKEELLNVLYNWCHFVTGANPRMVYVAYNELYKNRNSCFKGEEEIHAFFKSNIYNAILRYCS